MGIITLELQKDGSSLIGLSQSENSDVRYIMMSESDSLTVIDPILKTQIILTYSRSKKGLLRSNVLALKLVSKSYEPNLKNLIVER